MKMTLIMSVVMAMLLSIVTPSHAETWVLNDDLAAVPGWPSNAPIVGNWSMGWSKSLDQINLFNTWLDGSSYVWHTDLTALGEPFNPGNAGAVDGSTTPHGGFSSGKCFLAPANYIDPNDPNTYSVYSIVTWQAPTDIPELTAHGIFNAPANGGKVNAYVARVDDPNTINPDAPQDSVEMLYSYIDDNGPSTKEFRVYTSVSADDVLVFAIKRNDTENGDNNGLSLIEVTILDEWSEESCEQQGEYNIADINKDCYVNLADILELAKGWLDCNDPQNADCTAL